MIEPEARKEADRSAGCALLGAIYLACWLWTWGAANADLQGNFPTNACSEYRSNLAFSCGWSLLPPAWILAPFVTGFYEHGWTLSKPDGCSR